MCITHIYNIHYVINTPHSDTTKLQLLPAEVAVCTRLKQNIVQVTNSIQGWSSLYISGQAFSMEKYAACVRSTHACEACQN